MASLSNINGIFDVHSTGAILFSTSHGTSGQILRSNGNAAPTWVAASTVIGGPYLPLTGGTLSGATATASGISFTVGGALSGTSATFSGNVTVNARGFFNGGGAYPLVTSSTQRYNIQIRNTNNTVNAGYGWWWGTDTNFNMFFHADGAADKFTLTRAGNVTFAGSGTFAGPGTFETTLNVSATDGGGSPAMTAVMNMHGYEGRGVGIKMKDNVTTSGGGTDREWFVGTGYNSTGFNIGYASDGSQSSYPAQSKLSITTSGNATFVGNVTINGTLTIGGNSAITRSGSTAQGRLAIWQNDTAIKGDSNLSYASQYLTVGVGTTGGFAAIRINAATIATSYLDFTEGASFTKRAQIEVDTNDNMYFRNTSSNSLRMTLLSGGNFGINDSSPDHTLSVGGPAKISSGLLVGSMTLINNFTCPYFTHLTPNLNVDLELGNTSFWGHLEVTITGTYSHQNTPGKLTKIYAVGLNPNGTIYTNESRVSDAMGPVVTQINLGEVRWDSTTSTYRIRIAHIASTGNQYWVQVKGFAASGLAESTLPDLGISSIYTQSTTGLLAQIPSFKTEMATFSAATGSTAGIIANNTGYITSFATSATHTSSNGALFIPVTNGIKITQAGLLQVTLTQDFISTLTTGYAYVRIDKNNTVQFYSLRTNSNGQWDMFNSSGTMIVAANDVIGFYYGATDFTSMDTGNWSQYSFVWTSL